jgi:homoserine dehydrogenase
MTKDDNGAIETRVHPVLLPQEHPLAKVDGVLNAIMVDGDLTGQVVFVGQGAGPLPTSSAVVADVIAAAREVISGQAEQLPLPSGDATIKPMDDVLTRYYIRMSAADQPGVLAQIARVLGMHQISIASVIQKESDSKSQTAEIVIMTHQALERNMRMAIEEINELEITQEVSNFIRVEA